MFESSSKNRKSWDGRQMVWQWIPNTRSNRWKWFGRCHGGFTWRNAYWERRRRAECSRRHISWDERWKIGWLLRLEHSETALLKLTNDICENIDSGKITILTALDMSAAFDTLDHAPLLHRLKHTFGLSGFVISWIQSYLFSRSSFVKIDSSSSPITTILTGVPQGSVLGPLLFVLFISPIANVINPGQACNNLVSFHQYADDTHFYIGANSSSLPSQIASLESCTLRVHDWLLNNGLHLNPSKSEAIAFFNPRSKPLQALAESVESISVAGSPIKLQTSIKNLGVYLDSRLSFDKQVSETCKASYFQFSTSVPCATFDYLSPLRQLRQWRRL